MSQKEVKAVLDALYDEYKNSWELVRFSSFIQATSAGCKLSKPTDLIKFDWDNEDVETEKPNNEDLIALQYSLINIKKGA